METVELINVVVDRGSCLEDRNRRMERLKTRSTSETETDISSEQATHTANDVEDDQARKAMDLTLYNAATQSDVDVFINVLERVAREKRLNLSAIFNQVSPIGNTYLHIAAIFDSKEIASLIAQHFPTLITKKNFNCNTAMHLAARAGNWHTIERLLNFWKDTVDLPSVEEEGERQTQHREHLLLRSNNEKGNTAIHEALLNSQDEVAYNLIKEDPEGAFYLNENLESPLSLSAKSGSEKCVSLILSFQEELRKMIEQVRAGKSPVHEAITSKNRVVLEEVLSKVPRPLHFTDEEGRYPLHYAASMGYLQDVGYLLEKFSANAFQRDKNGLLPVHWAAAMGEVRVIKMLLLHCPHPGELLDQNGHSILHFVAKSGQYKAIPKLLRDPAFEGLINMKDKQGNTALHLAAMRFHYRAVNRLLWDIRVIPSLLNVQGYSALDVAVAEMKGVLETTTDQRLTLASLIAVRVPQTNPKKSPISNGQTGDTKIATQTKEYKDRVDTLLLVATLVATVTFAAGFTVPGGYNNNSPDEGIATLLQQSMFQLFIICDTIAMYSSVAAVICLVRAQLGDEDALSWALSLLAIALAAMSLAFMAGVSVAISKLKWLATILALMGGAFLFVVFGNFFPLSFPIIFIRRFGCIFYSPFFLPASLVKPDRKVEMRE